MGQNKPPKWAKPSCQSHSVYQEQERAFSVCDRIQFTAPNNEMKMVNRELGTVEGITQDGTMRLKLDNDRSMNFDPQRHPWITAMR